MESSSLFHVWFSFAPSTANLAMKIIRDLHWSIDEIVCGFHWIIEMMVHPKLEGWLGIRPLCVMIESLKDK